MQNKTICSVFWAPLSAVRPYRPVSESAGIHRHEFKIPAAKSGSYELLPVEDMYQYTYAGNGRWGDTPVYADDRNGIDGIATDLVKEWSHNVLYGSGDCGPGVGVIAGSAPTESELAVLRAKQKAWAEKIVGETEAEWVRGNRKGDLEVARAAAAWLGWMDYEWMRERPQVTLTTCPMCRTQIDSTAIICPSCHSVVDFNRYQEYQARLESSQGQSPKSPLPPPIKPNAPNRAAA